MAVADKRTVSFSRRAGHRGRRRRPQRGHRPVGGRVIVGAALLWIGYLHRMRKITWLHNLGEWAGRKFKRPSWVALPIALFITTIITRAVRLHLGRQPAHRQGPRPRPAGQPRPLLHPVRAVHPVRRRLPGLRAAVREARAGRGPHHPPLVRPGRRHPDGRLRSLRADRLPARRRLAPHLRPGRHAVGTHPPDADRRRRLLHADRAVPRARGPPRRRGGQPKDGPGIKFMQYLAFGGIVIGLSVYQIEFDFGVMQFRQVFEPMLIAAAGALRPGRPPGSCSAAGPPSSRRCWRSACAGWSRSSSGPSSARRSTGSPLYLGRRRWSSN